MRRCSSHSTSASRSRVGSAAARRQASGHAGASRSRVVDRRRLRARRSSSASSNSSPGIAVHDEAQWNLRTGLFESRRKPQRARAHRAPERAPERRRTADFVVQRSAAHRLESREAGAQRRGRRDGRESRIAADAPRAPGEKGETRATRRYTSAPRSPSQRDRPTRNLTRSPDQTPVDHTAKTDVSSRSSISGDRRTGDVAAVPAVKPQTATAGGDKKDAPARDERSATTKRDGPTGHGEGRRLPSPRRSMPLQRPRTRRPRLRSAARSDAQQGSDASPKPMPRRTASRPSRPMSSVPPRRRRGTHCPKRPKSPWSSRRPICRRRSSALRNRSPTPSSPS